MKNKVLKILILISLILLILTPIISVKISNLLISKYNISNLEGLGLIVLLFLIPFVILILIWGIYAIVLLYNSYVKKSRFNKMIFFSSLGVIIFILLIFIIFGLNNNKYKSVLEKNNRELYFSIQSNRLNCSTVVLNVYKNKTYEYVYEIVSENKTNSLSGTFKYDVQKIINNASNYQENDRGPYTLKINNTNIITLYDNNKELKEFLDEININLDTCQNLYLQ